MPNYLALPDEAVAELILWRLPVKSIIQCRRVCKSWYSLITSPNFISTHLRRKTLTENPQIFVHQNCFVDYTGNCVFLFENHDYFRSLLFRVPHRPPTRPNILTVGSINGLICLSISDTCVDHLVNFIVFNPSIGHFLSIPPPPPRGLFYDAKGFGFDERTQDYIILSVFSGFAGFIYSLNSHCWRRITCPVPKDWDMEYTSTFFVNGRFYWLAHVISTMLKFIMVFDMKTEAFSRISLPECVANNRLGVFSIMEFGESSIAVAQSSQTEGTHIWMMKEYASAESSWIKLTLGNQQMSVLGFKNKDEVLFRCESGCIASQKINNYKIDELEELKNIMDVDPHPSFFFLAHKYVPSLVLLDKENNVDVPAPTHAKRTRTAPTHTKRIKNTRAKRIKTVHDTTVAAHITGVKVEGNRRPRRAPVWQNDFIMH